MKLLLEDERLNLDSQVVEIINEATGSKKKEYYLSGVFSTAGVKNGNGRVYPRDIWEREVASYQQKINENHVQTLGEWEHPARADVDPMKAVIKITELKLEGDYVYGKAKILDNPDGDRLKVLIDEGIKIDISSRGVGSVGKNGIVEEFKLITYDLVSKASNPGSHLSGIVEGMNYMITESGEIVENKNTEISEISENIENIDIITPSVDILAESESTIDYKQFHSGVKYNIHKEILDNVFNHDDFKQYVKDANQDINDPKFMKMVITNILTSIKKAKKGDVYKVTSDISFTNPTSKKNTDIKFSKNVPLDDYEVSEKIDEEFTSTLVEEFKKLFTRKKVL